MISEILQQVQNTINKWCEKEQMSVNPRKFFIVPFPKRKKLDKLRKPMLAGKTIYFVNEVRSEDYSSWVTPLKSYWNNHQKTQFIALDPQKDMQHSNEDQFSTNLLDLPNRGKTHGKTNRRRDFNGRPKQNWLVTKLAYVAIIGAMSPTLTKTILDLARLHILLERNTRMVSNRLLTVLSNTKKNGNGKNRTDE